MSLTDIHTFTPPSLGFSNTVSQPANQSITEAASKQPPSQMAIQQAQASLPGSLPMSGASSQPQPSQPQA